MGLTSHSHLVPQILGKSRAIPLLTLRACVAYKKGEHLPDIYKFEYNDIIRVNLSL